MTQAYAMLCSAAQSLSRVRLFASPWTLPCHSVHGDPPGKNTGVGSLSLLHGNFPTHASNRYLLHCRQILYQLSNQGGLIIISHLFLVVTGPGDGSPRRTSQNPSLGQSQTTAVCVCGFSFCLAIVLLG